MALLVPGRPHPFMLLHQQIRRDLFGMINDRPRKVLGVQDDQRGLPGDVALSLTIRPNKNDAIADIWEEAEADALACLDFPTSHWKRLRTSNIQERGYRQVSCALSDRWVARRPVRLLVQQRRVQVAARPHSLAATYLSLAVTSMSVNVNESVTSCSRRLDKTQHSRRDTARGVRTSLPACASWWQPPHRSAGHRPCQRDTHIALPHGMPRGTSLSVVSLAGHHPPAATPPGPSRRQGKRAVRRRSASGPGEGPSTRLGKSRTWHC